MGAYYGEWIAADQVVTAAIFFVTPVIPLPQRAQGVAFAAKCRQRAGNPAAHTELACAILCGMSAEQAAAVTDISLEGLNQDGEMPAYEVWRQRVQLMFGQTNSYAAI